MTDCVGTIVQKCTENRREVKGTNGKTHPMCPPSFQSQDETHRSRHDAEDDGQDVGNAICKHDIPEDWLFQYVTICGPSVDEHLPTIVAVVAAGAAEAAVFLRRRDATGHRLELNPAEPRQRGSHQVKENAEA